MPMRVVSRFRYERKQRPARVLQCLLFAHVLIGSDTASTIHKFGKPLPFKEVSIFHCPKKRCWDFLRRQSPGNIGNWHCFLTLSYSKVIIVYFIFSIDDLSVNSSLIQIQYWNINKLMLNQFSGKKKHFILSIAASQKYLARWTKRLIKTWT